MHHLLLLLWIHILHPVLLELACHHHLHKEVLISTHLRILCNRLVWHDGWPLLLLVHVMIDVNWGWVQLGCHWHVLLWLVVHLALTCKLRFGRVMDEQTLISVLAFSVYKPKLNSIMKYLHWEKFEQGWVLYFGLLFLLWEFFPKLFCLLLLL